MGREEWAGTLCNEYQDRALELHSSWDLHLAITADLCPSINQAKVSVLQPGSKLKFETIMKSTTG